MGYRLYGPGTRKGNVHITARIYHGGKEREVSTNTRDEEAARQLAQRIEATMRLGREPRKAQTFADVADLYLAARGLAGNDRRYVESLKRAIGTIPIEDVLPMDIAGAANSLYPARKNETKNRQAYAPAAAVLHFAADNRLRDYVVIKKLPESIPENRCSAPGVLAALIANTEADQRRLLTVLRYQGWRITETLGTRWDRHVDLAGRGFQIFISKVPAWKWVPMHEAVFEALCEVPESARTGKVFPWSNRHAVYKWLRPLTTRLGVRFTPHMARHDFGTDLNDADATDADIAQASSWTSAKSTKRYTHVNRDRARKVINRL